MNLQPAVGRGQRFKFSAFWLQSRQINEQINAKFSYFRPKRNFVEDFLCCLDMAFNARLIGCTPMLANAVLQLFRMLYDSGMRLQKSWLNKSFREERLQANVRII